ncbi:MAG: YbaB/EbfC family nucleoid-associated protein [Streptosporangiales bacterium]|nr:YbaB/EbfC family nucleoid-associated protein [Streptosporangiales bacterium]
MNIQELLQQAQMMQQQLASAQQELEESQVTGSAGGGLVSVVINGKGEVADLTIDPQAIDPGDAAETAQTVADLVLAALHDGQRQVAELQAQLMGPLAEGLGGPGGPGGGLGLPGL